MSGNTFDSWMRLTRDELAARCVLFELENAQLKTARGGSEIQGVRFALASQYCKGRGIEVGAGDRPFPLPDGATALYGDCRDQEELSRYFGSQVQSPHGIIDAETFLGVERGSADFVISAHVIEHLFNPLGSLEAIARVLRNGGHAIIAAPEMKQTFDRDRPVTSLEHILRDYLDGGHGTKLEAFAEHVRYVHPLSAEAIPTDRVADEAWALMERGMDIHVHAWTRDAFLEMIQYACGLFGFELVASVSLWNENIVVLRRVRAKSSGDVYLPCDRRSAAARSVSAADHRGRFVDRVDVNLADRVWRQSNGLHAEIGR
ncbi:methyltransferase domain-containing protein [Sphingobium sp. V4]|uniref:class I SAM-dependent methyltransferase n=1 Tax=Sphingobium sp. V4 TaxID=3038927 RepID=UPI0025580BB1|nr:methyltransferase domain-containing protein [Sphingobium sp. V4]WIW88951.1 methyltransferase domain-containing protein [Sphingobium sp. V4]